MTSEQKVAIITGASRGIGAALLKGFRGIGYAVVANSRSISSSDVTSDPGVLAVDGDIALPDTAERIFSAAAERFGRIDTLVNNAGVFIAKPFIEYSEADFKTMLAVNLAGFFNISQKAASWMLRVGSGHIINITATIAEQPMAALTAALASLMKGGLNAVTRALAIEYASPVARFWIPVYGASSIEDWYVEGGHMAERYAGFIIIALGEAIVVNGATFADLSWTAETVAAFASAFTASIAMWWIYFHKGAEAGSELISKSAESGRLARSAYTYLHMPIVAGIILSAVADELVLKHPTGHSDAKTVLSAIGGPLLFLIGTILFKLDIRGFLQLSHGAGIIALCVLAWFASELTPLMLSLLTSLLLIVVAVWESLSLRSRPAE